MAGWLAQPKLAWGSSRADGERRPPLAIQLARTSPGSSCEAPAISANGAHVLSTLANIARLCSGSGATTRASSPTTTLIMVGANDGVA